MTQPVQINNAEDDETVEVPINEYEAIKAVAAGIAEQNGLVLEAMRNMLDAVQAQAENSEKTIAQLLEGMSITVNVPEPAPMPTPNIYFTAPESKPANVTVKIPPEKERAIALKVQRDKNGALSGVTGTLK